MKKVVSILAAAAVCMTMLSGCSRTVSPGDIEGYDEGEQYISLWVHIIEETPEGQASRAKAPFPFADKWLLIIMMLMIIPSETIITINFLFIAKMGLWSFTTTL